MRTLHFIQACKRPTKWPLLPHAWLNRARRSDDWWPGWLALWKWRTWSADPTWIPFTFSSYFINIDKVAASTNWGVYTSYAHTRTPIQSHKYEVMCAKWILQMWMLRLSCAPGHKVKRNATLTNHSAINRHSSPLPITCSQLPTPHKGLILIQIVPFFCRHRHHHRAPATEAIATSASLT